MEDTTVNSRWITLIAISAMPLLVPACTRSPAGEEKNVEQTLAKYIQSVNTADLKLASEVWLQTPVVSAVTPFGRFQGWESVRDSIYITFLQKAFTERRLEPSNIEVHVRSEEHTSELQSPCNLVCRLLLEKKKKKRI